jgi:hypothetical protein
MVRVGGGWCALDEFLMKNDPCRGKFHRHNPISFNPQITDKPLNPFQPIKTQMNSLPILQSNNDGNFVTKSKPFLV